MHDTIKIIIIKYSFLIYFKKFKIFVPSCGLIFDFLIYDLLFLFIINDLFYYILILNIIFIILIIFINFHDFNHLF